MSQFLKYRKQCLSWLNTWKIRYCLKLLLEELCLENAGLCFRKYCKKIFSFILVSSPEKSWKSTNQNVLIFMSVYLHLKLQNVFFFYFFLFLSLSFLFFFYNLLIFKPCILFKYIIIVELQICNLFISLYSQVAPQLTLFFKCNLKVYFLAGWSKQAVW